MIIEYDTRPNATLDEKLRSLAESVMRAFNEAGFDTSVGQAAVSNATASQISAAVSQINSIAASIRTMTAELERLDGAIEECREAVIGHTEDIRALTARVEALEE